MSHFRLSYNMVLNQMRTGEGMQRIVEKSFHQFQHNSHLPALERKLTSLKAEATLPQHGNIEVLTSAPDSLAPSNLCPLILVP